MGRIMINGDVSCYECGKQQHQMRGFSDMNGGYIPYCKKCNFELQRLKENK